MRLRPTVPAGLVLALLAWTAPAAAQQRPLVTEDPESIGSGLVLVEAGFDYQKDQHFPVSGLTGDLRSVPRFGVSIGVSSIAEVQIDNVSYDMLNITGRADAPLSHLLRVSGDATSSWSDTVVGAKTRLLSEGAVRPGIALRFATKLPNAGNEEGIGLDTMDFYNSLLIGKTIRSLRVVGNVGLGILLLSEGAVRPGIALRFATKLPNAGNEEGIGLDTMDFYNSLLIGKTIRSLRVVGNVGLGILLLSEGAVRPGIALRFATKLPNAGNEEGIGLDTMDFYNSLLIGKTIRSLRVVGNVGLGILSDPTRGDRQNDVLTYGLSFARAFAEGAEIVGEVNGRANTRRGTPPPGTGSAGYVRFGARFTRGLIRVDAALVAGLTAQDAGLGVTTGLTWVFRALDLP
jgi:hypothetical protein